MSPDGSRSASPVNARRRKACQYCFKRKIKCDMLEPSCTNCLEHRKECIPSASGRPRPTHSRIDHLEEENQRLRSFLFRVSSLPPESSAQALERWARLGEVQVEENVEVMDDGGLEATITNDLLPGTAERSTPIRPAFTVHGLSLDRNSRYAAHGPTSALFDNLDERDFGSYEPSAGGTVSEKELGEQATSKCAEERHMEVINAVSGRLDFDGVSPDLAMHLLALHWNRQHFAFLISYRPLFTRDMACGGPYFSKLLLNAIFFSVAKFSARPEVYDDPLDQNTAGRRFLRRVKELLGEALDQSTIPTIQAMLLLSSSLFALGHQSAAWLYNGIAREMILDLGLNYDCLPRAGIEGGLKAEEIEIRRRIVWAAFIYDKIISLYQGRPVSFDEDRMHVPHRFLDRYEEQELWTPFAYASHLHYPGRPARAICTFTALCSLSVIMGRIITQIYADKALPDRPADLLRRLSASLDKWKEALPPDIAINPNLQDGAAPPPHVMSLHLVYYTVVTLLHRPFVEWGHHRHADPGVVEMCWARCEEAARGATALLSWYRETFTLARAPYLISYTTFVAATIHVRIAAQRGSSSEAARSLGVCLEALEENAATNTGVRKMFSTISGLMGKLGVVLPSRSEPPGAASTDVMLSDGLDLSAIIRSFGGDLPNVDFSDLSAFTVPLGPTEPQQDNLYGFLGLS